MSKGPGAIERRVADLLAATRDRALSVVEIIDHAFQLGGRTPTRAQRISATRAAHRVLRRVRDMMARTASSSDEAERKRLYEASERIGFCSRIVRMPEKGPDWLKIEIDYWQATTLKGRLWLHLPDVPVQVWAVTIDRQGVHWFDTKITKITERNVMVRYHGVTARLDRQKLYRWWALFRNVMFVSSRTGRIAAELDALWQRRYGASGGTPPSMQMPLEQARLLLGLKSDYTHEDVLAAFRRKVKTAHPHVGGTAEMFRLLVEARDRLLRALGTSAPPPKAPQYAPWE